MRKHIYLLLLPALLCFAASHAQITFPQTQVKDPETACYAFTHVHLQVDENTSYPDATLVIKDGLVLAAGPQAFVPKEALVMDMHGAYIYPSFVDPFSTYGIHTAEMNKKPKPSGTGWNDAVRTHIDAFEGFAHDGKRSETLLEMGYGATASLLRDGIARGSATLVLTDKEPVNELIIRRQVAAHYSFNKGSSSNEYPSSLMGSIALLRQTAYDARWYAQTGIKNSEYNYTLERWNSLQNLPQVMEVNNKLSVLRAMKLGKEFGTSYIIKGSGDEYQVVSELKGQGTKLIIPVELPAVYKVDATSVNRINTRDLRHWYMAPYNASILNRNGIDFCFTSEGVHDAERFWKNLRLMQQCGLDEKQMIKALCRNPARFMGIENLVGSLLPGRLANFIVCSAGLSNAQMQIQENWVRGKRHQLKASYASVLQGKFKLNNAGQLQLSKNEITLVANKDTCKGQWQQPHNSQSWQAWCMCSSKKSLAINGWIDSSSSKGESTRLKLLLDGAGYKSEMLTAKRNAAGSDSANNTKINKRDTILPLYFPNTDYGQVQKPMQEFVLFKNATVWTGEQEGIVEQADVAIGNGKILAIGKNLNTAAVFGKNNFTTVDATGKHITAGIIDEHSHIAIERGVNECTQSVTSEVRVGDVIQNEDVNIYRQLSGGVTTSHLLHGSCNTIGGQTDLIKLRWGETPDRMKFEGHDPFIKFALGENVKRSNGDAPSSRFPQTRMGVEQVVMDAFARAKVYGAEKAEAAKNKTPFRVDLELEALLEILNRQRFITCHSYVQSEINMLIRAADSMGFKVNTFTHVLEGYKVADKIKAHGAAASTFADWWAYKYEVIDAIPQNACILNRMGVVTAINSDDGEMGRRLNQEAAKSVKYCNMSREDAWKMVTLNPAKMLHIDNRVGSIKPGKDADLVLWNNDPLSIYAAVDMTWVDGKKYFDRNRDRQTTEQLKTEREWLLQKMLEAQKNGEQTTDAVSGVQDEYHCEDH